MSIIQDFDVNSRIKGSDGSAVERSSGRTVERVRAAAAAGMPAPVTAGATDEVQITASARTLLTLQQALAEVPDVDVQKVERIRRCHARRRPPDADGRRPGRGQHRAPVLTWWRRRPRCTRICHSC
jgi:hypothetical protein